MTDNNKKWYNSFAIYPTSFVLAVFLYMENIASIYLSYNQHQYAVYFYASNFLIGFVLYAIINKIPVYELSAIFILDSILNQSFSIRIFSQELITSIIGVFVAVALISLLIKGKSKISFKSKVACLFRNDLRRKFEKHLVGALRFIYILILIIVFLIVKLQPSNTFQVLSISSLLFIAGITVSYITKKIPILIMFCSLIIFYPIVRIAFSIDNGIVFLINYSLLFLPYYILGALSGFGIYKATSKYLSLYEFTTALYNNQQQHKRG